jgi:hypothetical protein
MDNAKRKRVKSAGWKVGTTAEFLGLGDEDAAIVELRLGRGVREERNRWSLTRAQLGKLLGSSHPRVAKMEAADPSVSIDLMIRSLLTLGASRKKVAFYIAMPAGKRAA